MQGSDVHTGRTMGDSGIRLRPPGSTRDIEVRPRNLRHLAILTLALLHELFEKCSRGIRATPPSSAEIANISDL